MSRAKRASAFVDALITAYATQPERVAVAALADVTPVHNPPLPPTPHGKKKAQAEPDWHELAAQARAIGIEPDMTDYSDKTVRVAVTVSGEPPDRNYGLGGRFAVRKVERGFDTLDAWRNG